MCLRAARSVRQDVGPKELTGKLSDRYFDIKARHRL
jgi:hypothetical protein